MAYCSCGNNTFQVSKKNVLIDEKHYTQVKFIVCSNPKCQQVIGVLPKISKTKIIKIQTSTKPDSKPKVPSKPKGAVITGVDLVQNQKPKQARASREIPTLSNLANTKPSGQTSTISSDTTDSANIGNANVNATSGTLSETKSKKAKR